jgi:hypothetical protein
MAISSHRKTKGQRDYARFGDGTAALRRPWLGLA